jgi:DNA-binding PadR family transcriptional regulator
MRHDHFGGYFASSRTHGWGRGFSGHPFHHWFSQMMSPEQRVERGEVRYLILDALSDKSRHGYDIIREIEKRSESIYKPSPGAVYPTLQLLEESGFVRSREEEGRKLYELTDEGRKELKENQEEVEDTYERLCKHSSIFQLENFQAMSEQVERIFKSIRRSFYRGRIDSKKINDIRLVLKEATNRIEEILKKNED